MYLADDEQKVVLSHEEEVFVASRPIDECGHDVSSGMKVPFHSPVLLKLRMEPPCSVTTGSIGGEDVNLGCQGLGSRFDGFGLGDHFIDMFQSLGLAFDVCIEATLVESFFRRCVNCSGEHETLRNCVCCRFEVFEVHTISFEQCSRWGENSILFSSLAEAQDGTDNTS